MSQENDAPDVVGRPVDEAVEAVVAADEDRDADAVRATLDRVAEDGVVSRPGVREALAHLSKVVSTPETRLEVAERELSAAREDAEPVADLDTVRARLDAFEAELATVEERVSDLGEDLQALVARRDDDEVYELARDVRELETRANAVQRAADEVYVDAQEFQDWVADPDVRVEAVEGDVEAVEESVTGLVDGVDRLASDAAASGDGPPSDAAAAEPAVTWYDLGLRRRVTGLLVADLRAELADHRAWAEREGNDPDRLDALAGRLDEVDERLIRVDDRLDELARPAWTDRFGERLAAVEDHLDATEPPVDWGALQATLDDYRLERDDDAGADEETGAADSSGPGQPIDG